MILIFCSLVSICCCKIGLPFVQFLTKILYFLFLIPDDKTSSTNQHKTLNMLIRISEESSIKMFPSRSSSTSSPTFTIHYLYKTIIILGLLKTVIGFCPNKCICSNYQATCINAGFQEVPIQLNPDVNYINLTLNQITTVLFSLSFYTKLEILDLSRNKIETLGSKNFEYQNELRMLNLSQNSLTNLSNDAFKHLRNLKTLDLSNNKIETIDIMSMQDLISLIKLDLSNNNVISFDDGVFSRMQSLEILLFRNNQLLDVPYDNLEYVRSLKTLDLSENLIESVRNYSFDSLRELTLLNLQGNVLSDLDLDAFEGLVGLKVLDLADNNLTVSVYILTLYKCMCECRDIYILQCN